MKKIVIKGTISEVIETIKRFRKLRKDYLNGKYGEK